MARSSSSSVRALLARFRRAATRYGVWDSARALSSLKDDRIPPALIEALDSPNTDRQSATAHFLREFESPAVVAALIAVLRDKSRTPEVRGEAAESLGEMRDRRAVPALLKALNDESAEVRFWAVFGVGHTIGARRNKIIRHALEQLLNDSATVDTWWSIGREAQAMLASRRQLQKAVAEVLANPGASAEDRRWAECYSYRNADIGSTPAARRTGK